MPLRKPRHKWENTVSDLLRKVGLEGVEWIRLTQIIAAYLLFRALKREHVFK